MKTFEKSRYIAGKLQSNKGETLVEVLCGILIMALASMVLINAATSSTAVNKKAIENDKAYRAEIENAEVMSEKVGEGQIEISKINGGIKEPVQSVKVDYYGGKGELTTYQIAPDEGFEDSDDWDVDESADSEGGND